ncbi:protein-S-isoprenylcysteine O-methyltransferase [Aaosphaeria arxii CBS 175.79]|uniref:Protein-S-isoprenylcysteine O-methyltransferase n=1 Tax=Aaosphaeria arxii CBS 175.79 TaxID=1450172 RepID=A0A6A5X6U8_9PLEO|nr:protein-S-isoprenylcysteine O-methyltransferase [Aaosphaeria arxii CBS 175.79]KAF2008659.1 protein-S-isoprenylcysteine O-methyltransferase [Aaosphaeria arxii CBS 175.79]
MADTQNGFASAPSTQPETSFSANRTQAAPSFSVRPRQNHLSPRATSPSAPTIPHDLFPGETRSLSGIALRAFLLGMNAALGYTLTLVLLYYDSRLWRPAFFVGTLCTFHFLEFWTTARYNTPAATTSSFLLTNGARYRQAHTFAFIESLLTSYFLPHWQSRVNPPLVIALGVALILVGQVVRSLAMVQAGTNFNHHVQSRKNEGHVLVTEGLYAIFRHPSYFGFFWWGLGTQVALGNTVSFVGYTGVLWYFFQHRIINEEIYLVAFFGKDYEAYRARTRVWIPFIR